MSVLELATRNLRRVPGVFLALLGLMAIFGAFGEGFFTLYNLVNICKQGSILVIVAMGTTLAILTGGIDLSTGSVLTLSGVTVGLAIHNGLPIPLAILMALLVGCLCGGVNGYLIAYLRFHHFIATFGMMGIAQGIALAITQGAVVPGFEPAFRVLGDGT
ncbi:MAG: ABC transporter permease, partial [Anaerolineae bacterium]